MRLRRAVPLWIVVVTVFVALAVPVSAASGIVPASSAAAVAAAVTAAESATNLPSSLQPSLEATLTDARSVSGQSFLKPSCDPSAHTGEATQPTPCFYGDLNTKRILVLFGDSFVGNWIPALDIAGRTLRYKVALFGFQGCVTPLLSHYASGPGFSQTQAAACLLWHRQLGKAVKALAPTAVLAANGAPSWGSHGDVEWINGVKAAFDAMASSGRSPIDILIGTGPHFTSSGPACVAAHPSNLGGCSYRISSSQSGINSYAAALARDARAAQIDRLRLIATQGWVCQRGLCPPVVNKLLVYVDRDHLTTAYSSYLANVMTSALAPLVPH